MDWMAIAREFSLFSEWIKHTYPPYHPLALDTYLLTVA